MTLGFVSRYDTQALDIFVFIFYHNKQYRGFLQYAVKEEPVNEKNVVFCLDKTLIPPIAMEFADIANSPAMKKALFFAQKLQVLALFPWTHPAEKLARLEPRLDAKTDNLLRSAASAASTVKIKISCGTTEAHAKSVVCKIYFKVRGRQIGKVKFFFSESGEILKHTVA